MGPPCGPSDGWAILHGKLYCSIWRSYQDNFNANQQEGIALANARWIEFYGSLEAGPQNNGCYAWNYHSCLARSIYIPPVDGAISPTQTPAEMPTGQPPSQDRNPLFSDNVTAVWSEAQSVMGGAVQWRWTLEDLTTAKPQLIIELNSTSLEDASSFSYVAFGVAENLMQGPLVVCSLLQATDVELEGESEIQQRSQEESFTCQTLLGSGMGTIIPESDPVQPRVITSVVDSSSNTRMVRFSASLFDCWSEPRLPARALFSRGLVSGSNAPQAHLNDALHREAVVGVDFLSVVEGYDVNGNRPDVPADAVLEPLPDQSLWQSIDATAGSLDILEGRVRVYFELFRVGNDEIITIQLEHVKQVLVFEEGQDEFETSSPSFIGFAISESTMTGLVITCSPHVTSDDSVSTVTCHQWRGIGTNLYPLATREDAGGWHFLGFGEDPSTGTLSYKLAGRVKDVVYAHKDGSPLTETHLRAICAVGRAAPDSRTPLIHDARNRQHFQLDELSSGEPATSTRHPLVIAAIFVLTPLIWLVGWLVGLRDLILIHG